MDPLAQARMLWLEAIMPPLHLIIAAMRSPPNSISSIAILSRNPNLSGMRGTRLGQMEKPP